MPSHTYMRVGRYGDAVRANQMAWQADIRAAHGGAPGIYPTHNLHMLLTAAAFDGQSAVSMQAARDLARDFPTYAFYPIVAFARFGRWEELSEAARLERSPFHTGIWHFGRGLAHLAVGESENARAQLAALEGIIAEIPESAEFRGHPERALLGIARGILAGEAAAAGGRYDEAIRALREAIPLEDSLVYDEPEPWPIPVRHVLGAILLEAGRAAEAEAAYREELRKHPENGWSLLGLEQSLREQGETAEADVTARRFAESWERADVWVTGSRIAPRPPGGTSTEAADHH